MHYKIQNREIKLEQSELVHNSQGSFMLHQL